MKRQKIKPLIKFIVAFVILIALLAYLTKAVWDFLRNSEYFKIKEVTVINNYVDFPNLKGRNIFSLDLLWVSNEIKKKCPDQRLVRVSKKMPDAVVIEFERRLPLAVVKLDKDYFVDAGGILFDLPSGGSPGNLTVIQGLKINNPKLGSRYNSKELDAALGLIMQSVRIGLFKKYPIKSIDVSNAEYLIFCILDGLKIKITPQDMQDKLGVLLSLISQVNMDLSKAEYIDLRFKDPAIKLKVADEK